MLPLLLDLRGKRIAVLGAGKVGLRKARYLSQEAEVRLVDREAPRSEVSGAQFVQADLHESFSAFVSTADMVVAATDDEELNSQIEREAKVRGKWCNRADGMSTFLIPSVVRRDGFIIAVSTEGRSPAMSRFIREWLEQSIPKEFEDMVRLQEKLRSWAKENIKGQERREDFLWSVLKDDEVWNALRTNSQAAFELAVSKWRERDG
ncbi:MAG: bifunctional precorrin-2 dehydrogenase/sirohydrochlorin ferrochelatase [Methanomassiliicoccales archaeon]